MKILGLSTIAEEPISVVMPITIRLLQVSKKKDLYLWGYAEFVVGEDLERRAEVQGSWSGVPESSAVVGKTKEERTIWKGEGE